MLGGLFWFFIFFTFYAYVGYPVLITLLAHFRPRRTYIAKATPYVTLLISAYKEEEVIAKKLQNSLELDYPRDRLQILVVNDGQEDRTAQIVRDFAKQGVELSQSDVRGGKSAAINRAIPLIRGEVIVFSDANNMYDSDYLRQITLPFSDKRVGGVVGSRSIIVTDNDLGHSEGLYWRYESYIREQESRLSSVVGGTGEAMAIRTALYVPQSDNVINDDFFIAMAVVRQGYDIVFNKAAKSFEMISASDEGEIKRRTRIIAGRYQAMFSVGSLINPRRLLVNWQLISHKFTRPLVPFAMIGALIVGALAVLFPPETGGWLALAAPYNWGFLALHLLFYVIAWLGNQPFIRGKLRKVLYVPTFLVNSNLAALRGLHSYMSNREGHLWERVQRVAIKQGESASSGMSSE